MSYRTLLQRYKALSASQAEAAYLLDRWQTAPGSDGPAILLLEDLVNAQNRLAEVGGKRRWAARGTDHEGRKSVVIADAALTTRSDAGR